MNFLTKLKKLILNIVSHKQYNSDFSTVNQPCFDKNGKFIGWFSRSIAAAIFVFCRDKNGSLYVLASERGKGAADFQGYWNCPCGYLEFGMRIPENAVAECFQETGIAVNADELEFMDFDDSPSANHQNVTFHYRTIVKDKCIDDFTFSHKYMEENEVGKIKWVSLNDIDKYKWAFNHDSLIKKYSPENK